MREYNYFRYAAAYSQVIAAMVTARRPVIAHYVSGLDGPVRYGINPLIRSRPGIKSPTVWQAKLGICNLRLEQGRKRSGKKRA